MLDRMRAGLTVIPVVLVLAVASPARAQEPVSEGKALAIGLAGTFVPVVAGGLIMTGMAVDDRWFTGYMSGTYAIAGLGLAVGPALAYAYMGKKVYASVSAASRLLLIGLGVGMMWSGGPGIIVSLTAIPVVTGVWAILDLALVRHIARKTNRKLEAAVLPWTDGRAAGLALCGRF